MQRLRRQLPFLRSVLQEANRMKRQDLLKHANADQINAVSELVLNLLKNKIPITPPLMAKLRPHKKALRGGSTEKFSQKTSRVVDAPKREWIVSRSPRRPMPVYRMNPVAWVNLLREENRESLKWKKETRYWKHKYEALYRDYMRIRVSQLCERCRFIEDGELCSTCNELSGWKKST